MATLTLQVAAGADDCLRRLSDGTFLSTYSNFTVGRSDATFYGYSSAARFLNVNVPQGSTINSAYLTLYSVAPRSTSGVKSRLRAEATDNSATFSDKANFDARTWSTAYVNWDNISTWNTSNSYNSPEIKTIIQEVINRSGWSSGNAISIFWDDLENRSTGGDNLLREAAAYETSTSNAPKLVIDFTPPKNSSNFFAFF